MDGGMSIWNVKSLESALKDLKIMWPARSGLPSAQLLKRVGEAEGRFAEFLGYRVGSPPGLLPQKGREGEGREAASWLWKERLLFSWGNALIVKTVLKAKKKKKKKEKKETF